MLLAEFIPQNLSTKGFDGQSRQCDRCSVTIESNHRVSTCGDYAQLIILLLVRDHAAMSAYEFCESRQVGLEEISCERTFLYEVQHYAEQAFFERRQVLVCLVHDLKGRAAVLTSWQRCSENGVQESFRQDLGDLVARHTVPRLLGVATMEMSRHGR